MVIVTAIDRSGSEQNVVREGQALANAYDEPLHVVHCLEESEFRDLERTSYEQTGQTVGMDELEQFATEIARDAIAGDADEGKAVGLVGNPTQRLLDYAADVDARYLVVGGRQQSPVGKVVFGSITQSILLEADRPVVTVMEGA